ncbi:hypothetical protein COOONC_17804, partial [Cooperia oncophora]
LHKDKTHFTQYPISDVNLNSCEPSNDPGVQVDSNLKLSKHIELFRNAYSTDVTILLRLYKTYVLPHLEYCSQIWDPTRKKQIIKLEKVQKMFTKLLFHHASCLPMPQLNTKSQRTYETIRLKNAKIQTGQVTKEWADSIDIILGFKRKIRLNYIILSSTVVRGRYNVSLLKCVQCCPVTAVVSERK